MSPRTVILSFDMEPDVGSWTSQTRGVRAGSPAILRLLRKRGVGASFLFTGREARACPEVVRTIRDDGHEIGCHTLCHETVGQPVYDVPVGGFILEEEIPHRLALATDAVADVAGVRPVSFRAPRLFGSSALIRALAELGYKADSSLPAYFHGRDFTPYRPALDDWTRPGVAPLVEIPVFYDLDVTDGGGAAARGRDQWPQLRMQGGRAFAALCRRMFERLEARRSPPLLCVYLHPWEFVPIAPTLRTDECTIHLDAFLHEHTGTDALQALDEWLGLMNDDGITWTTMADLAARCLRGQKECST